MNPAVEIVYPWVFFLAIPALPLLWLWSRRSLDPLTAKRRRIALLLRACIVAVLLAALADMRWMGKTRQHAAAWLIDVSDSVGDAALDRYREQTERGELPNVAVEQRIPFAGTFRLLESDVPAGEIFRDEFEPDQTRLDQVARFPVASLPADHVRSLFLLTDGNTLSADWEALADKLKGAGVRVFPIPVKRPDSPEVLAAETRAPQTVRQHEPFRVEVNIVSNRNQSAELQLFRGGVRIEQATVELTEGTNRFEFTQTIERDNLTEFTARIEADGDTFLDNNERSVLVHAAGEPRVLFVTDAPEQARFLHWALRQEGIELEIRPEAGAPASLNDLQNFELLVLDNIPAASLSLRQLELYSSYVDDFGGGFLMLGGDQSFGLGGYFRTPVDEMLPLRSDFEMDEEAPSLGLALVIDKSGSMSGERMQMAIAAAQGAVELLRSSDYAGVVVFDGDGSWAAEMQSAHNRDGLRRLIGQIQAGGGTNLAPAMALAHRGLSATPSKIKHAIILSDGHSQPGDFTSLTTAMASEGITVSTLGVGQGTDIELLQSIARLGNGRFYFTDNNRDVPQIMARETMAAGRSAIDESPFSPVLIGPSPFLHGIDFSTAPFLYGYVKTRARPTADVWLNTEQGKPLLATWRYGLGNVGAFTSDARNRWAVEWLRWEGFSRFWAQVFRQLMRDESTQPFSVEVTPTANGFTLSADALTASGDFLTDGSARVLAMNPASARHEFALENIGPGRYQAHVPAALRGNYHFDLQLLPSNGGDPIRKYVTATVGFPEEYLLRPPATDFLESLAADTDGVYNPELSPEFFEADSRQAVREHPLWPWLTGLALFLFLLDVTAKRLPSPFLKKSAD